MIAKVLAGEIIIIEDFSDEASFSFLKSYIDLLEYPPQCSFAGRIAQLSTADHQKVKEAYLKRGIILSDKSYSRLRLSLNSDEGTEKRIVHTDAHQVASMVYLSDPPDTKRNYGTNFYMHKTLKTKFGDISDPYKAIKHHGLIELQSMKLDRWEVWKEVQLKKNRMILFSGNYFHSQAGGCFGRTIEDGRMTLDVFSA